MFTRGWRRNTSIGALLAVLVPIIGAVLLVYVTFVRKPINGPGEFLKAGRHAAIDTVVVNAGSSTTHASASGDYVARLRERFGGRGYEFVNAGANGDTSADLLRRLDDIVACQPDAVTILIGTNDLRGDASERATRTAFRDNLEAILERLRTQTDARVALLSLQPVGEDLDSSVNRRVLRYSAVLKDVAAKYDASYLPFGEELRAVIEESGRPPSPHEFSFASVLASSFRHYVLRQSWDQVADHNGFVLHTDGIHLSDRAADVAADLIARWLAQPAEAAGRGHAPYSRSRPIR